MISFRYHVVSLVAVLLALAVGVVLGSGPLRGPAGSLGTMAAGARPAAGEEPDDADLEELRSRLDYEDAYADATAPELLGGRLSGRAVTVVALPGARPGTVADLVTALGRAGGSVTAQVQIGGAMLDVTKRQLVEELAAQVADTAGRQVQAAAGATGYERLGRLLARALVTEEDGGERVDRLGERILAAVASAELAEDPETLDRRGSLAVVVTGPPTGSTEEREGASAIIATLVAALDAAGDGVVLAGPPGAARTGGILAGVRRDSALAQDVSTVDVADRAAGAVVTVLALEQEVAGRSGHHGMVDADGGPLPGVPAR